MVSNRYNQRAYAYNIQSQTLHQLKTPGQSHVGRIIGLSADKRYALMPAYGKFSQYSLFKVYLTKRRRSQLHSRGTHDTIDFFVGLDGQVLARERYHNDDNLHRIEARIDDEWHEIFREIFPLSNKII